MKYIAPSFAGVSLMLYALLFWPPPESSSALRFTLLTAGLVAAYFLLIWTARGSSLFGRDRAVLLWLAAGALLIRVLVVFGTDEATYMSRDVYRYVWEGKLIASGYNPYVMAPGSAGGRALADNVLYPYIDHPDLPSVHPPLAQYLFAVAYFLHSESIHGFRLLSVLAELLTLLGIVVLAAPAVEKRPFQSWSVLIYAFSPVVLIEFLLSNHVDILAMPFFVFALVCLRRDRPAWTGLLIALTALVNLGALIFAPVILMHFMGRKKLHFLAGLIPTMLILYLPFLPGAGSSLFDNALEQLLLPEFNSSAYNLIELLAPSAYSARIVFGALLLALAGALAYPLRDRIPKVSTRLFILAGAYVILTPSLFPWHLVWILPFVVLSRHVPFLVLSGLAVPASHFLAAGGNSDVVWWVGVAEYAPFYLLLVFPLVRKAISGRQQTHPVSDRTEHRAGNRTIP